MLDLGLSKMALIGAVALIVIGPEKLPRVARTVGTLLGKAQRYVADVKAEVNRSMDLEELKKMKDTVESAARDVEQSVQTTATDCEKDWAAATTAMAVASAIAFWRLAQIERADQVVKALAEQFVDFAHHTTELCSVKVALHHVDHVEHQEVALGLHDGAWVRPDKEHDEVIA